MTLAVLPLALTLIAGLAFRLRPSTNMTIAIFSLMSLLFLELAGKGDQRLYRISRALVVGITLTVLVLSPAIAIAKIWFGTDINYVEPRKELAREATRIWHETTASPLPGAPPFSPLSALQISGQASLFASIHLPPAFTDALQKSEIATTTKMLRILIPRPTRSIVISIGLSVHRRGYGAYGRDIAASAWSPYRSVLHTRREGRCRLAADCPKTGLPRAKKRSQERPS